MKECNHMLSRSLKWLGVEAITYQLLFLGHQLLLFRVTSYQEYGLIGTIFSLVYLAVSIFDFGLESSISPFFSHLLKSRIIFKKFILQQLLPSISIAISFFIIVYGATSFTQKFHLPLIDTSLFLVLGLLVLTEMIKKFLRTLLHLAFFNRAVATIEIGTMLSYIVLVWFFYGIGYQIHLWLIFAPMLITSLISMLLMLKILFSFWKTLPNRKEITAVAPVRILKSRLFTFLNQLSHTLFSSNFLIPFFALQFGLTYAGIFKLVSHIAYALTSILRKTFGVSSDTLLAKTKEMSTPIKQKIFLQLTQQLNHALYAIVIFFIINYSKIVSYSNSPIQKENSTLLYLFLIICLSENIFIAYEKLYITQERSGNLLAFNLMTMMFIYTIIHYGAGLSLFATLIAIISVRMSMFIILGIATFYFWHIRPQWKPQPHYLVIALLFALGFFILF